jgi:cytochrome c
MFIRQLVIGAGLAYGLAAGAAYAENGEKHDPMISDSLSRSGFVLENGLAIPAFDAKKGRLLFGSKGCAVCHSVNGVGGEDAPEFSADVMEHPMNAFDFAANMWRGAAAMIMMQEDELGEQIELSGEELAAIIAFIHDEDEQKLFSKDDIPEEILEIMEGGHDEDDDGENDEDEDHG